MFKTQLYSWYVVFTIAVLSTVSHTIAWGLILAGKLRFTLLQETLWSFLLCGFLCFFSWDCIKDYRELR